MPEVLTTPEEKKEILWLIEADRSGERMKIE